MLSIHIHKQGPEHYDYKLVVGEGECRRTIKCFGANDAGKVKARIEATGVSVKMLKIPAER